MLKLDYDFGSATLTSVTGYETLDKMYSRGDIDGGYGAVFAPPSGPGLIPFPSESADGLPKLDQFTQELRLASDTKGRWDWLLGFYYFDESLQADTFSYTTLAPGNPVEGYAFQTQDASSWAGFASVDFRPTDRWNLKGGLRYTTDQKDFSAERPDPTFQLPTLRPIQVSTDADLVTWDLSATYKATENVNLYSRVGTGFRAPSIQGRILFCADFEGGTNPATNCVSVADEEKITSFEAGVKTEIARKLRLNVAGFVYQVDGQQIVAVGGQYNTATLLNADKSKGYGLEADLDWAPSSDWLFTLGASYNHTEIDDPNLAVATCGGGCTVTNAVVDGLARVDGNPLPHAPKWILSGIVDYRHVARAGRLQGQRRLGLPQREELLPLPVEGVRGRLVRARRPHRLRLPQGEVRDRRLRTQPDRRGDRPERHRLQQPDRHDQRAPHDRLRDRHEVLRGQVLNCDLGGSVQGGQVLNLESLNVEISGV